MIIDIRTESGSSYVLNTKEFTWKRTKGRNASTMRSDEGIYKELFFDKDDCLVMICEPFAEFGPDRVIQSTQIVSMNCQKNERTKDD